MRPRLALVLFLALAVIHTWPLASAPGRLSLNYNADAQLNAWIVSWVAHGITSDPLHLFDGNIFAPEPNTLAYSEPLIVPALAGAPIRWLGGSPVLTFNILVIAGLVTTAFCAWFVVRRWTNAPGAALVAGALAAFNVHLLTRLPHLAAAHAWGVPLAIYLADKLVERPSARTVVLLALVIAATAATTVYWLALVGLAVIAVAAFAVHKWRSLVAFGAACALGLGIAAPVLIPYVRLAQAGHIRPIEVVAQFSATPAGYLSSTSRVHAAWSAPFFTNDVDVFFAGFAAFGLALAGLIQTIAGTATERRRGVTLVALAVVGVVLSLGPSTAFYRWLYEWCPPLKGLRASARFGFAYLTVVALAAGLGASWIVGRFRSPRAARLILAALLAVASVESWQGPTRTTPFDRVPAIYRLVAGFPDPVLLVEVPFYPAEAVFENGEYVLNATGHWRPVMNGYSGLTPESYRRRASAFWFFPEDWAIDAMRREGATHLMVHLERFTPSERADVERALDGHASVELLATDRDGHRLYRLGR
jgi:hypothetical protein